MLLFILTSWTDWMGGRAGRRIANGSEIGIGTGNGTVTARVLETRKVIGLPRIARSALRSTKGLQRPVNRHTRCVAKSETGGCYVRGETGEVCKGDYGFSAGPVLSSLSRSVVQKASR